MAALEPRRLVPHLRYFLKRFGVAVVGANLPPRHTTGPGYACGLGFCSGFMADVCLGLFPPYSHGLLGRGRALWHLPAPRLDGCLVYSLWQLVLQPLPRLEHCVFVWLGVVVRHARRHHFGGHPLWGRTRDRANCRPRYRVGTCRPVLALDHGL